MEGMAQTKYQQSIVWREAGMLPTINNEQPNIGLSGIITGIIGGQLLIGGGNNFPAGLPWEGGTKKYYIHSYSLAFCQRPTSSQNSQ